MIESLLTLALAAQPDPIRLDGQFHDWGPVPAAAGIVGEGSAAHVYLLLTLAGPPGNLQGLEAPLELHLDWDNNADTRISSAEDMGTDLVITFSPDQGQRHGGIEVTTAKQGTSTWDSIGLAFAPTTAANRFEIAIPRTLQDGITAGDTVAWKVTGCPQGPLRGVAATKAQRPAPTPISGLLGPADDHHVRVVSWNLEFGNILHQRSVVQRLLATLQPHVILMQEIEHDQSAEEILEVLRAAVPDADWTIDLGPLGGTIRSGIASRIPCRSVPAFDRLKRRGESRGHVRAAALVLDVDGVGDVLAVSAHLKCCGVVDGPEDLKRIGEVLAIRRAVAEAEAASDVHGLIVGGDLNLVGGTLPLDLLIAKGEGLIAADDSPADLHVVDTWQPDGSGMQTWQEAGQAYAPGRLDFIVISGSSLTAARGFVLDTLDLPESDLAPHRLVRTDAGRASDHLPVVVDLMRANAP
ncbi:MAG: endonuclease/exonuclease/phosphatase family protein [Phycisphaerales bacterium]|jgi:endonuclease/exonuclease/phosphatase family metal-dependent hydrolase|nr:endonuclease/exonuclease/phosphatase family protein [Phycisphaerales bacterium]